MTADLFDDLVTANHILAREGVVDGFGHASIRHPERPDRYVISVSRSPERVVRGDLVELTLEGEAVQPEDRSLYLERHIHGAIYEARPDVHAVIHNHSLAVIPFGLTGAPLPPVLHVASGIGRDIPTWDIRDKFGDTDLLVTNMEQGRDLAKTLADHDVALMRGHGCVVVGGDLRRTVMKAIYLQVNAEIVLQCQSLGTPKTLSDGEIEKAWASTSGANPLARVWDYWKERARRQ